MEASADFRGKDFRGKKLAGQVVKMNVKTCWIRLDNNKVLKRHLTKHHVRLEN